MRTTLTLDDDVAARIETLRRERRLPLREVVNRALRAGIAGIESPRQHGRKKYRIRPAALGPRLRSLDNISEVIATAEREDFS